MTYRALPRISDEEMKRIMESGTLEELIVLPLSIGEYYPNWKVAQDLCVNLSEYCDERVRSNAALGLAYIARTKNKLEKHIVKPVLLKLLCECCEYKWRIIDAIQDVNTFMKWHIGEKAMKRFEESQQ